MPVASLGKGDLLGICHLLSIQQCVVFFQLHGGMVSLMQAVATPYTKYLDTYHENISVLTVLLKAVM